MCPTFGEFITVVIKKLRGDDGKKLVFKSYESEVNNMKITVPIQAFINGEFCDAASGETMETIDPSTEKVICEVPKCAAEDVDRAVRAADEAFHYGEWSRISPRERGRLMYKLADLMDEHREELATIEAIDAGAVYTLALKTHVGMSIEVWRYFAGWTDKIHVSSFFKWFKFLEKN